MRCIGGKLRVVAKRQSALGLLHDARFGIADADSLIRRSCRFQLAQLLQFLHRLVEPFLLFPLCSYARLLDPRVAFLFLRIAHLFHASLSALPVLLDRAFALNAPGARRCPNLRAVLHHLVQRDQPFFAERRQHLREQLVQLLLLLHTEIRQRVVVHFLQSGQPLEGRVVLAAPRHFARRTDPLAVGVHPQTDQQLRIERRPPAFFCAALDPLVEPAQIHTPDQRPDRPRRMILADQSLYVHRTPAHLLPVHPSDQRLVAHIFLAHAASLRHTTFFARVKFRGFLHSFNPARMGSLTWLFVPLRPSILPNRRP